MDAATNGRSTRDRAAAGDTASGPAGELIPVLMRIPDVRPPARGKAKRETVASAAREPAATPVPPAVVSPPAKDDYNPSFEITYPSDAPKEKTIHLETPAREIELTAAKENLAERAVDSAVTAALEDLPATDDANELATPIANESATQPATNRRQRQRRAAAEPKTNWWKTQGRALAIVFVIGLSVTIYLARAPRGKAPDTAREDETSEFEITAVSDDALDAVRPSHSPDLAGNPKTSAPPLAEQPPPDDEPTEDDPIGLDEVEEAEQSLASSEEDNLDMEADAPPHQIDFGELPDSYVETDPATHRPGGRMPRTAKTPNSSSTR